MNKKPVDVLLERACNIINGTEDSIEDWRDAIQLLEQAANLGSSEALVILGDFYRFNSVTKKSLEKSVSLYKKAATEYCIPAYVALIHTYVNNFDDIDNAVKVFRVLVKDIESNKVKLPASDDDCEQIQSMAFCLLFNCLHKFDEHSLYMLHPQIIRGIHVIAFRARHDVAYYTPAMSLSITALSYWLRLNAIRSVGNEGMTVFEYLSEIDIIAEGFAKSAGVSREKDLDIAKGLFPISKYLDIT